MDRFGGKVALVSGAAGGIGGAVVERLRSEGATVVGADVRDAEVTCDVTDEASCRAAVDEVVSRHGRLDVLANIAGLGATHRIVDFPADEWRRIIEVNLTGTFLLSKAAVPPLLETHGCIVNLASVSGLRATPYNAAYTASKGGVVMLTKSMAIELIGQGVRVNAVCPAAVETPFLGNFALPEGADQALFTRAGSPLGRLIAPAEVAAAVAYLASEEAAAVTGTTLVIDGAASA